jgi:hypothetical protein
VNFVLGAGLHSYGFGGGGQGWVYLAVSLELLYAGLALHRSRPRQTDSLLDRSEAEAAEETDVEATAAAVP